MNYQWIHPSDSLRISQLKIIMGDPQQYGLDPDLYFSVERARSVIRRVLPSTHRDRAIISELSYTLLYSRMIESALYSTALEGSPSIEYCTDSLLFHSLLTASEHDDLYTGLIRAMPGDIGERLSWVREFIDSVGLDYPGREVPIYKEDSIRSMIAVQAALQDLGMLSSVDSLVDSLALFTALRTFQECNGLAADGQIGRMTVLAFAKSNQGRLDQLKANLSRVQDQIEWDRGATYIEVNVPEMTLRLYKEDEMVSTHRVVVGRRKEDKTPSFKASLIEMVVNPEWNVPFSISTEELLPKQLADSNYLSANHYRVTNSYIESIDPLTIDWTELNEDYFPYNIIQEAGPWNALGKVKFLFPNQHMVYIHDTPSKSLFYRSQRDLSHGCVRVQHPYELALQILDISRTKVDSIDFYSLLDTAVNYSIPIYPKIPVVLNYESVRKDDNGALIFYQDIYGLDSLTTK